MSDEKPIYGRIDCPVCKTPAGVRITKDKNGQPFGFCDATCEIQMRIGGKPYRVQAFYKHHPDIAAAMQEKPVTVTEQNPVTDTDVKQEAPPKKGFNLGAL